MSDQDDIDPPKPYPPELMKLLCVLGDTHVPTDETEHHAFDITVAARTGEFFDRPSAYPATVHTTDLELNRFVKLCEQLLEHIHSMHEPAVDGLRSAANIRRAKSKEKFGSISSEELRLKNLFDEMWPCHELHNALVHAIDDACAVPDGIGGSAPQRGRRPDRCARLVTEVSASAFKDLTGGNCGFTSDPDTGEIQGPWPEFLKAVFGIFGINASVASLVRAYAAEIKQDKQNQEN